ncbi:MAG: acetyl ornithine aminotransferase family protein [Candidatus Thermoplasmatota archaeon]|jgi:4-aminobutyrate aminotransferase|nr:acetyl ornithine aminotransferase family protein [Candidatus Thermoplasmatota archaeon]
MITLDTQKKGKKNAEMNRINIKGSLPGKNAKKIIAMDTKYLVKSTKSLPVVGKRGKGLFVEDVDGNVFLDFASGISVTNIGHVHPYVTQKVKEQLDKLWHFAGTDYYYEEQVNAAKALTEITPGKFDKKVFFSNSGTESNEASLKIAKAFTGRQEFISFIGGFHGRTNGSLSFTASKATQRRGFFPTMPGVAHVPYPNPYRNPFGIDGYEHPSELVEATLEFIEKYVLNTYMPPEDIAAFMVEPIQGEGGYIVPPKEFHKKLRKMADDNNILIIMDEVQTGFGRTGKFFASEHFSVEPEIISLAKAIASGIPMGASVINARLDFKSEGMHSNTFGGNLIASAACVATIEVMKKEKLVENSAKMGKYLMKRLLELQEDFDSVGDVRGLGLMTAIDFVKNRKTKEPAGKLRDIVERKAYENGLLLLSTGLSAIRIIPALNVTEDQIDMGIVALEKAITESLREL